MTLDELKALRRKKWRLDGAPVRTFEECASFLEQVGLCPMVPETVPGPAPTFLGAWAGSDAAALGARGAVPSGEAAGAESMALRLVREGAAWEWPLDGSVLLIAASVFPFVSALAGDREGKQQPSWAAGQTLSKLSSDVWAEFTRATAPLNESQLRQQFGSGVSEVALRRAIHELWRRFRIARADCTAQAGNVWVRLSRSAPAAIKEAEGISVTAALSALVSRYLEAVIAAEQGEVESFFSILAAGSRVREAIKALLIAREIATVQVGNRSMLQITPAVPARDRTSRNERTIAPVPGVPGPRRHRA
ncbi:MAG: hypothetical protein JO041_15760 [Acidobacteria bacterium]|nr:hypothetical protein [Acidobacteriota bacterium]